MVLRVNEGQPVRVASVEVVGLEAAPEAAAAGAQAAAPAGRGLHRGRPTTRTRAALLAALKGTGWATAKVSQEAQVLPSEHAAHVSLPGRGRAAAAVRGARACRAARAVSRERIRAQAALEIKPGDWYDEPRSRRPRRASSRSASSGRCG